MFNGKIHYKWPFSIAMLVYRRVIYPHIQDQRVMAMLGTVPEISRDPVQFVPRLVGPRKVSWFIQFTSVIYSQWISWSTYKRLNIWLVVWNIAFVFHHIWDVTVSFPLTNSYLSRWLKPPTRCIIYIYIYWNPLYKMDMISIHMTYDD